ncbi:MAG TPA: hypothetical protein VKE95_10125 [Burkholderiales bacterium]|nr:hypothetical protein [Burkholderiales bacterium]
MRVVAEEVDRLLSLEVDDAQQLAFRQLAAPRPARRHDDVFDDGVSHDFLIMVEFGL